MMTTTHAAMGLAAASLLSPASPELATTAGLAALAGGVFPDLDVVFAHRKTLHHPEGYTVAGVLALAIAVLQPGVWTVAVAAFLLSAAVHSLSDVLGGGLGRRPWEADDERGIYLHLSGRWVPPRRLVRYDGAPEDLLVAAAFSVPPLLTYDGLIRELVVVGLAASVAYVVVRKWLVDLYEAVLE
jgi:hypothetical protein